MTGYDHILVFLKYPRAGSAKTRLARQIGNDMALDIYRALVVDLFRMLDTISTHCTVYYHPPEAGDLVAVWLGDRRYHPQQGADLGERMGNAFHTAFADGAGKVLLIGSDAPGLTSRHIEEALLVLDSRDAVIGPAFDGGYYLIGFTRPGYTDKAFSNIIWSSATVFAATIENLNAERRSTGLLPKLSDVDTAEDLAILTEEIRNGRIFAPATQACLEKMMDHCA